MKHLLSLERFDVGRTLALTVGSPSAHRRGIMLKHVAFLLLFLFAGFGQAWATDQTATYTVNAISTVTTTGTAPQGSSATVDTNGALDGGRARLSGKNGEIHYTLTLSGYDGCTITGLAVKLGSNTKAGNAALTFDVGNTTLATISSANLNSASWFGAWVANGSEKTITLNSTTTVVGEDEDLEINITNTANSAYVYYISVTYTPASPGSGSQQPTALSVPTGMSSGTPGMNSATLSWNTVANASGYALTIGTNEPITTGFTTANNKVSYTLNNLDASTTYTWKVKAVGDGTNYSNSADCATQNFTTADDPTQKVLTFDLSTNNLSLPTAKGSSVAGNYTYTLNDVDYTFSATDYQGNSDGGIYFSSSYTMMYKQNALGLPAISNYKLTKVVASNSSSCSTSVVVSITDNTTGNTISGGTGQTWSTQSSNYTYNLTGTDYNTVYYVYAGTANAQITQLKLTYAPKPAVSSISIKTAPTKTTYTANENFDPSGLIITVNYSDNTSEDVAYGNANASDFTFSPALDVALNALHTGNVTITYGTKTTTQAITVNRIATSLSWSTNSYVANAGDSYSFPTLTKTPENLAGVTYSSSNTTLATIDANGVVSVQDGQTGSTTITASFDQTNVYAAATPASYELTINAANTPLLEVDPSEWNFEDVAVGENDTKTIELYGYYLSANASLAISGTNAAYFTIDKTSVEKDENGEIAENITVTYAPTAAGSHTATLTISSTGATPVEVALSGQAKVRRTVTWYKGDAEELTAQERGSATTSVLDGDEVTAIPAAPASCDDAISFMGWTDAPYAKNDAAPTPLYTTLGDFPAISGSNATYYAVWAKSTTASWAATTLNNITASDVVVIVGSPDNDTYYAMENDGESSPVAVEVTVSNDKLSEIPEDNLKWNISGNSTDGYVVSPNGDATNHLYCSTAADTKNNTSWRIGAPASGTNRYLLEWSEEKSTMVTKDNNVDRYLCLYLNGETHDFRSYIAGSATPTNLKFFKYNAPSGKDYTTTCVAPVEIADPTFSLEGGTYNDDQTLTISKTAPATTIYYTDDNSDPKNSETKKTYSSALTINQDVTIKAIATDGNGNWSEVVSKTYVINYSTSIAAFIEKAQASARALKLNAAQNCIITGIREYNSKYDLYIQDASNKGIIVYGLTTLPEGAAEGKRIEGAISGTYALASGQHRITGADFTNATFNAAEALTPTAITAVDADAYNANPIMLVKLSGVYYNTNTDSYYFTSEAEGEGTSNYVYDSFKKFDGKTMPANTVACDITGILINYNGSTPELLPLSLTTSATAVLPAISPEGGADAENAVEVTYMSTVSVPMVENEEVYISVNDAEPALLAEAASVQIEGDVKLVVSAKRDFYADNTTTYYYKPSSYPKQIAVSSEHGDVTVKVGDNTVSTALPESAVTFTVAEAAHFHIASVAVNYEGGSLTPALSEGKYSFTMPDKDVTIALTYTEDTHYTITYAAGGATSGSAPAGALTWQYADENVELLANEYVWDEDHNFTGWKVTYNEEALDKAVGQSFEMPAANVTITAQWAEKQYCALTLKVNGADYLVKNIEQDIEQTISGLAGYVDPESQSGYDFFGWAESQEADDVTEAIATIESYTPQVGETSKTLYAVFKRVDEGAPKTDVLTAADFAATSTGYVEFSDVSKTSNAVYAGNSAKDDSNIQLRSKNSNSGIVSTTTGGVLKSVKITVASGSNTIDVYGSNTAYSAASDLYGSAATQGTKIGSTSSTTTINAAADYNYVGIRSNNGAIYLSSVEITWQPKTTYYTTAPSAVYAVSYDLGEGAWAGDACDGANVKAGQTFDICESVPVRDHYKFNGWTVGGNAVSGAITINAATAITAVWEAKVENNITYNAGTGTGDDAVVENNEEGAEIVLPSAAEKSLSKDGYDFVGWLYNDELYKAGQTFEMPASAVQFVAQWKKQNITKMTLVTDASQLVDGSKVVIAQAEITDDACKTMGAQGTNNRSAVASTVSGNVLSVGEGTSEFTLVSLGNNLFAFQASNGNYLYAASSGSNYLKEEETLDNNGKWTISIASNGVATIKAQGTNTHNWIQYNAPSNLFSCYGSGQKDIAIYASMTTITDNASISDLGYVKDEVIVVENGKTLTIDEPEAPTIIAKEGATVTVDNNDNTPVVAKALIVENGSTVNVKEETTVNEVFHISAKRGQGNGEKPTTSSKISGADKVHVTSPGYFDFTLAVTGATAAAQWHDFSVPFPVNALTGVYGYKDGEWKKLTNEVDYAILDFHGDFRADGKYSWKKFTGELTPGKIYSLTVNGDIETFRFMKTEADYTLESKKARYHYNEGTASNDRWGWNGLGNSKMNEVSVGGGVTHVYVLVYDEDYPSGGYKAVEAGNITLMIGSAFLIQTTTNDADVVFGDPNSGENVIYYAPARSEAKTLSEVKVTLSDGRYTDNLFLSASEDATPSYEIGKDLTKMFFTTVPAVPTLYTTNYNGTKLAVENAPLNGEQVDYTLTLFAPKAGEYTLAATPIEEGTVYLTKDGRVIWNLSIADYTTELAQGSNDSYGIRIVRKAPGVATGMENVQSDNVQCTKVIIDNQVFILRGGQMYDVTGKAVK